MIFVGKLYNLFNVKLLSKIKFFISIIDWFSKFKILFIKIFL